MIPYINEIHTKILKRKYVSNTTHIIARDDIVLNYKKYHIEKEEIFINNRKVLDIYDSNLGPVFVVDFKPHNDKLHIKLDYSNRIKLLKSFSLRPLIESVLKRYFNLEVSNFYTSINESYFDIDQDLFNNEADKIVNILIKNINEYIKYGIDINPDKSTETTKIAGFSINNYFPYTISNLSELTEFEISHYEFVNSKIRFYYDII